MSIVAALGELSNKRKQIEEAAREQAKAILAPGLQEFMKTHPDIKSIRWSQYTPYFNDGEECVFSVNGIEALSASHVAKESTEDEDDEDDSDWKDVWGNAETGFSSQSWSDLKELESALETSSDELRAAFGDHVRVIVTQTGVDVEEYEHD